MSGGHRPVERQDLPTTFVSPTGAVHPTKNELTKAAIIPSAVTNPSPGVSSRRQFRVTYKATVTTVDLPANGIVTIPTRS